LHMAQACASEIRVLKVTDIDSERLLELLRTCGRCSDRAAICFLARTALTP
jgi:hypothetical protein